MYKILIIWDGEEQPLNEFRKKCIKQVKIIYPNTELVCITKNSDLMKEYCDTILSWEYYDKLLWKKWYVKNKEPRIISDFFRYLYLSINEKTLYLDTDIYLTSIIEETDNIAKYKNDYCAIWNSTETGFFEYIVNRRKSNGMLNHLLQYYPNDCCDLSKWMIHKSTKRGENGRKTV